MKTRKIALITGSRADYGLLHWLMREIQQDPALRLQTIVTGTHLAPEFGATYRLIETDGFEITAKVEMLLSSDSAVGVAKALGLGVIGFADAFDRLKPDIVVVLGDRFEILAAAQAALVLKIPMAHLHGGELTEGAIDESMRHAITKMAYWHFATTEVYKQRIIHLGEDPAHVYNLGAPGLDWIKRSKLLSRKKLEKNLELVFQKTNFLITYHPVTVLKNPVQGMVLLLKALSFFPQAYCIFTQSNADEGGRAISALVQAYLSKNPKRGKVFTHLGSLPYLSVLKEVDVVIGNSSSALIEAPLVKTAAVNIGIRQQGRLSGSSVIHCEENVEAIIMAIKKSLSVDFQKIVKSTVSLYGQGNTSHHIKEVLKKIKLQPPFIKRFYEVSI